MLLKGMFSLYINYVIINKLRTSKKSYLKSYDKTYGYVKLRQSTNEEIKETVLIEVLQIKFQAIYFVSNNNSDNLNIQNNFVATFLVTARA